MANKKTFKIRYQEPDAERIYFTSDTHFGHLNIMKYSNRPFSSIEEHDKTLIENWNNKVPKNGIVYHLGDVGFASSEYLNNILSQLHGKIHLIVGNHDHKQILKQQAQFFETIETQFTIQIGEQQILLNHCPLLCYPGAYRGWWQLFGHVHSGPRVSDGLDLPRLSMLFPTQYDVGVDNNNFTPVSYTELQKIIQERIDKSKN